ncbi:hypothetical protein CLV92_12418 [Kineococcus xinjiangensis]|uniref:ParB/Sulfiredoxin domain-containing protein n=1 Tax=Kineococcus xinjiangensis TaxID=512762 RepID=A0A2S6IC19_9ACTN|nr:ParB/RepB/Spo0J family partition protein [Kineococcus xinjiangensis]PPK90792.1 hypothetical protein CLV92_12418 [Kineococcus xinjiangensis]
MPTKFGVPPQGAAIRSMVEERLQQARVDQGAKVTVDWRGQQKHLDVIAMPVDILYFNPETHRIRAQRTVDPEKNRVLEESPWGTEAQAYLQQLLQCKPSDPTQTDPDFTILKDELDEFGQKDPGIITPDGILVDGNTRCAALRELGEKHIRVAVLPGDTGYEDIAAVEIALQLRRDKRRDYSYINRLIAIEEQLAAGRKEEDIARVFNTKVATLRKDRWVYSLILDAISRSETTGGAALRLIDFEGQQEKLREIYRDYDPLRKTDPEAAERLKEARLAMVILNYAKTTMRYAGPDFHKDFLEARLPQELRPAGDAPAGISIPGLGPDVVVPGPSARVSQARALTDALLRAKAAAQAPEKLKPADVAAADSALKAAKETFDRASQLAGKDAQLRQRQVAVPERLTDAADFVNQCSAEFAEARSKRILDEDTFDDALLTLRESLVQLARQAGRAFETPGDGVAWLLAATRDPA